MRGTSTQQRIFELDTRSIGLFRIALGLVLIADQFIRMTDWHALHGPDSIMSEEHQHGLEGGWVWSVYWITEHRALPYIVEVVRFIAEIALVAGIRSRLAALILFVILASVNNYNPLLLQGGDRLLGTMVFFAALLPLGGRYALESLWHGRHTGQNYRSITSAAYAIQVCLVFLMSGLLKTDSAWTSELSAISMALHLEDFTTEFSRLWRHLDGVAQGLTFIVIGIEWLAPVVALAPGLWTRSIGLCALIVLEGGIWMSLEVGLFPLISVVSLMPLIPGAWLNMISGQRKKQTTEWILYYDAECRFCRFLCRGLRAACGWEKSKEVPAQDDEGATKVLHEHGSWSIRKHGEKEYTAGWQAVIRIREASPWKWATKYLPRDEKGEKWYRWIGDRREKISRIGTRILGASPNKAPGIAAKSTALTAILTVISWNVTNYPAVADRVYYDKAIEPYVGLFGLRQYWNMFAPKPHDKDWWLISIGLDREGRVRSVFNGQDLPHAITVPRDGPEHYGGYRWRKILRTLHGAEQTRAGTRVLVQNRGLAGDDRVGSNPEEQGKPQHGARQIRTRTVVEMEV